jgi:hypothetical protein
MYLIWCVRSCRYKNPKQMDKDVGGGVAVLRARRAARPQLVALHSAAYLQLPNSVVPQDEKFMRQYFEAKSERDEQAGRKKRSKAVTADRDLGGDDDFDDEDPETAQFAEELMEREMQKIGGKFDLDDDVADYDGAMEDDDEDLDDEDLDDEEGDEDQDPDDDVDDDDDDDDDDDVDDDEEEEEEEETVQPRRRAKLPQFISTKGAKGDKNLKASETAALRAMFGNLDDDVDEEQEEGDDDEGEEEGETIFLDDSDHDDDEARALAEAGLDDAISSRSLKSNSSKSQKKRKVASDSDSNDEDDELLRAAFEADGDEPSDDGEGEDDDDDDDDDKPYVSAARKSTSP